jgi:hypothetical protein
VLLAGVTSRDARLYWLLGHIKLNGVGFRPFENRASTGAYFPQGILLLIVLHIEIFCKWYV